MIRRSANYWTLAAALMGAACQPVPPVDDSGGPPSGAVCGNGIVEADEACDEGPANDDNGSCTSQCAAAACGDGLRWEGVEECDDGVANDDTAACTASCASAACGDGLVWDGVEECDDGSSNADDAACTTTCAAAACGDGLRWKGVEECDDGNVLGGDGCSPDCALPQVVDLAYAGATLLGEEAGDWAARSVADAGDVNGDGFGDVIVGASNNGEGGTSAGAAYLVLGPVFGAIDLSTAEAKLVGEDASDFAGGAVAGAGDVNADGFDDLIIGANGNDEGGTSAGAAYIVLGPVAGTVDLGAADAKLVGESASDLFGESVDGAGDINGDGYDDVILGAYLNDEGGIDAGAAYVFHGPLSGTLDASTADAKILGEAASDFLGLSVGTAGDVNGDGIPDLVLGAYWNDEGGTYAGAAYLVHGPVTGTVELATDADAKLLGEEVGDQAGASVAAAGDVDGDGFDDLLVGAPLADSGALTNSGAAYLVRGPIAGTVALSAADAILRGDGLSDQLGISVSGARDVNGDGLADILVGAYGGETYLILGEPAGVVDPVDADATLIGAVEEGAGVSVSTAGDVDGDGLDDLIVGARLNDLSASNAGAAYIVYGSSL